MGRVSLAQGFPDFACPPELKRAVAEAVDADINQYAITWGSKPLRDAIAETTPRHFPGWGEIDPETAGHGHLRRDRGDDRGDARASSIPATRSSSSSRTTRTTGPTRSSATPRRAT